VDNPINILQQEEAKQFFHDLDDEKLYKFFAKATLIENMRETFDAAKLDLQAARSATERKETEHTATVKEMEKLQKILNEHRRLVNEDLSKDIYRQTLWLQVSY